MGCLKIILLGVAFAANASDIVGETNQGGGGKWLVHVPPCNGIGGMCSTCEKQTQPMVRLRGLCRDSDLTNLFTPVNDEKSALGYVGLSQTTSITYNASTFMWVTNNMGWSQPTHPAWPQDYWVPPSGLCTTTRGSVRRTPGTRSFSPSPPASSTSSPVWTPTAFQWRAGSVFNVQML